MQIRSLLSDHPIFEMSLFLVMAGHSRSKNGVATLAYVPAIYVFLVG